MNTATPVAALSPAPINTRFIANGDGTVTQPAAGLMWSQATLTPDCIAHQAAEKVCADLALAGFTDWRLPTIEELFALADRTRSSPAIDTDAFHDTQSDWYWSSTITAWSSNYAWIVNFNNGNAGSLHRVYGGGLVRAVRSVAPGQ